MARTPSTMAPLMSPAPDFALPDTDGNIVSPGDYRGAPGLLVMFICNHCPYVIHLREALAVFAQEYSPKGLMILAINSNDVSNYPDDSPEKMREEREAAGYLFPYLYDESQEVAKAYQAACTPDFFLYNAQHQLVYRGQFDASRPGNEIPATGADLRAAVEALFRGELPAEEQHVSLGCNIKWKPGNAPDYF